MNALKTTAIAAIIFVATAAYGKPADKPLHALKIETVNCGMKVAVNGVVLLTEEGSPGISTLIPLNEWLQTGTNNLTIEAYPLKEQPNVKRTIYCKVTGVVTQHGRSDAQTTFLPTISATESVKQKAHGARVSREAIYLKTDFSVKAQLPVWKWVNARKVAATKDVRRELVAEFTRMHGLYQRKARKDILKFREQQSRELAIAYYKSIDETEESVLDGLDIIAKAGLKLADLDFDDHQVALAADGRLATLHDSDGDTPLAYFNDDSVALIKGWFYQGNDGKWVLIR